MYLLQIVRLIEIVWAFVTRPISRYLLGVSAACDSPQNGTHTHFLQLHYFSFIFKLFAAIRAN